MKLSHRLVAASVGAVVLTGVLATPAMAAPSTGALTITPATGQFNHGDGDPTGTLQITPPAGTCPAGAEFYQDMLTEQGSELTGEGAGLISDGAIFRDPADPVLTVGQHEARFQSGSASELTRPILPAGTSDVELNAADAAKETGALIATGDYSVVGLCFNGDGVIVAQTDIATVTLTARKREPKPATWDPRLVYAVLLWDYSFDGGGGEGPAATSVSLTASPAGSAAVGAPVNLTATVTPSTAAGEIEFFDGATSLGTEAVTAGSASFATNTLTVGTHSVRAVFTPDDAEAYNGSTGTISYSITQEGGGGGTSGAVTLQTTVPTSGTQALTLTVDQTGAVSLPEAVREGDNWVTGKDGVNLVTVTDTRAGDKPGWDVNGKVSDNFVGGTPANTFAGTALGWKPLILDQTSGQGVTAGQVVTPGTSPGLTGGALLAAAPEGSGVGTAKLGADLDLAFPATTAADTYSATVTITVI
ncbi:Ig-like domain-containing protein [Dactylosporangium siamense]|uniref:Bacterial Ig-like domain-containing protein n=1 Tax=Dactylosporangium siamense TaxID=685454 RepID=A0A919PYV9_9ACTN|nr:Ig-like domain-containing protein [Dactylosporangium siamense]GIG52157.1 hypothetical protein Dsi01nite_101980 [Dactylosporangium siamense]